MTGKILNFVLFGHFCTKLYLGLYLTKLFIYNNLQAKSTKVQKFSNSFYERNLKNVIKRGVSSDELYCIYIKSIKSCTFVLYARKCFIYKELRGYKVWYNLVQRYKLVKYGLFEF